MSNPAHTARIGRWLDAFFSKAAPLKLGYRKSQPSDDDGVPEDMVVGPAEEKWGDSELVEWRMLPSRVTEAQVRELEAALPAPFPPLFRAYLTARHLLHSEFRVRGHSVTLPVLPSEQPLADLHELLGRWRPLLRAGYIPLGDYDAGGGPLCADTSAPAGEGDHALCFFDHDALFALGEEAWAVRERVAPLARPLWPSFEQLLRELEAQAGVRD